METVFIVGAFVGVAIIAWIIGFFCGDSVVYPLQITSSPLKDWDFEYRLNTLEAQNRRSCSYPSYFDSRLITSEIAIKADKKVEMLAKTLGYEWKENLGAGWEKKKLSTK